MDFEEFYRKNADKHLKKMQRILYMDKDLAQDVVQEAYTKAFMKLDQYDKKRASLHTWFNYILYSTLREYQRDHKKKPEMVSLTDDLPDQAKGNYSLTDIIEESRMSEDHKEVVFLYYVLGFTNKEVAAITDKSVANITTICNRFKKEVSNG